MLIPAACTPQRPPSAPASSAPAPGWVVGTYEGPTGSRFYRMWVPRSYDGTPRPLLVMLHGCQQTASDFATGTRMNALAEARNFLVLYPEQSDQANPTSCWNWGLPDNQVRDSGEAAIIAGIIGWATARYRIDTDKIAVAGISAGASMASVIGCTYPDLVRGVASVAGVMYAAADNPVNGVTTMTSGSAADPNAAGRACAAQEGSRRHPMGVLVFHGSADKVVNPVNAEQTLTQWARANDLADGTEDGSVDDVPDASVSGNTCRAYTRFDYHDRAGTTLMQRYLITDMGHAWPGGDKAGSFTDPCGPDAATLIADRFGM